MKIIDARLRKLEDRFGTGIAYLLLDRFRQQLHQRQSSRYPTGAAIEAALQFVEAIAEAPLHLEEMKNAPLAPAWSKLKKTDLAMLAEREAAATGWLPAVFRRIA